MKNTFWTMAEKIEVVKNALKERQHGFDNRHYHFLVELLTRQEKYYTTVAEEKDFEDEHGEHSWRKGG